jgi:hypothetical protein
MGKPKVKINANVDLGTGLTFDIAVNFTAPEEITDVTENSHSNSIKAKAKKALREKKD